MRVVVFGNSGAGKSTLARQLAADDDLEHLDLDTLAWEPATATPTRRALADVGVDLDAFTTRHERWVIEGCYADLLELVADRATRAVFLDLDVEQCQEHARARPWEPHKYASPEEQDANLPMLLEWIAAYETRADAFSRRAHEALFARLGSRAERRTST